MENRNKCNNVSNENVDDIVSMIDQFMKGNGGHLNVSVNTNHQDLSDKKVEKTNSLSCAAGNMACQVPTLHDGLDIDEQE